MLQLTTVIEADQRIPLASVTAEKRAASPTQFTRERIADGKDHFVQTIIDTSSIFYGVATDPSGTPSDGTNPLIVRDDTGPL